MNLLYHSHFAGILAPTVHAVGIGYSEVTWHLMMKLFPVKSLRVNDTAKSMMSEGNTGAFLPLTCKMLNSC